MTDTDTPTAMIRYYTTGAYDGPGWYWLDDEYPDEGAVGAFESKEAAIDDARASGYSEFHVIEVAP